MATPCTHTRPAALSATESGASLFTLSRHLLHQLSQIMLFFSTQFKTLDRHRNRSVIHPSDSPPPLLGVKHLLNARRIQ